MADPKDPKDPKNEGFLRKVVRFVANPATDWADLNTRQAPDSTLEAERSELKAMVERKKRNDFVRAREFDMLRRIRREGLTPQQLAALAGSAIDDSDVRASDQPGRRGATSMKAKIDAIEQQMVGPSSVAPPSAPRRPPPAAVPPAPTPTQMAGMATTMPAAMGPGSHSLQQQADRAERERAQAAQGSAWPSIGALPPVLPGEPAQAAPQVPQVPQAPSLPPLTPSAAPAAAPAVMATRLPPLSMAPLDTPLPSLEFPAVDAAPHSAGHAAAHANPFAVEVSELAHDPDLDEAVISFANADFAQCEESLTALTGPDGARADHAESWLVLFDLFRATGQQHKFETLALEYAQRFGWSSPQWFSLPKMVAQGPAPSTPPAAAPAPAGGADRLAVGWAAPALLDAEAIGSLHAATLQLPLPWVLDWRALQSIEPSGAVQLSRLLRQWADEPMEMHWLGGAKLLALLAEATPTGLRDVDPALWSARLDALRLADRADQFDEVAIDYCVTYEVSPPSWERPRCRLRLSEGGEPSTHSPNLSQIGEVSTGFVESDLSGEPSGVEVASVELSGQLIGDISDTLRQLDGRLGLAPLVVVNCQRLIRVDFIAAGDLLNWVLAKASENRNVIFADAHRLLALFFGAMGINEHARVKVRNL